MKRELSINPRLRFAFQLCLDLGIDDPVYWMDGTSEKTLDWWMAYYLLKDKPVKHTLDPMQALAALNKA